MLSMPFLLYLSLFYEYDFASMEWLGGGWGGGEWAGNREESS